MRYLGDVTEDLEAANTIPPFSALTSVQVSQLTTAGALLTDDRALTLATVVDASPYGERQKYIRLGIGAAVGLAVGAVAMKLLGGRL